jgi:hypothetical protein
MDMPRDAKYEEALKFRKEQVFDEAGVKRTQEWAMINAYDDRQEKARMAEMEPVPTHKVDQRLKNRINEEFLEHKDLHKKNLALRSKVAFNFKSTRELFQSVEQDRLDLINKTRAKLEQSVGQNQQAGHLSLLEKFEQGQMDALNAKKA